MAAEILSSKSRTSILEFRMSGVFACFLGLAAVAGVLATGTA
jgi:hypothetical protein